MGARDNQNSANGGSCYCKNPAVHGGSIKKHRHGKTGQRVFLKARMAWSGTRPGRRARSWKRNARLTRGPTSWDARACLRKTWRLAKDFERLKSYESEA
jgi:hypothetical protein